MADVASSPTSRSRAVEESTRRPGLAPTRFDRVEKSDTLGRYGPLFVNRMARDPGRLKVHRGIGPQYAGSVLGLPLWLILAVCVVPPIAYSLSRAAAVPVELILPTAGAMEVVFLTQTVQQALRRAEVRRHFGFALWELHQELSQHLESLDRRMTLVRQGVNSEPNLDSLRTWASSVDAFPVDAWDRFLAIGGLHRLLDSAPDQVASNLYRYYHGVGTFNNEAALRERLLQKLFNVTGPATAGIFKSVKSSDKRLES